jgi:hypothetical protein
MSTAKRHRISHFRYLVILVGRGLLRTSTGLITKAFHHFSLIRSKTSKFARYIRNPIEIKNECGPFLYSDQNEYGPFLYSDENEYGHFLYSDQNEY